jgi:hypothetical protein
MIDTVIVGNNRSGYTIVFYILNQSIKDLYEEPIEMVHKFNLLSPYDAVIQPNSYLNINTGLAAYLFLNGKRIISINKILNGSPIILDIVNYNQTPLIIRRGENLWKIMLDGFDKPKFSVEFCDTGQDEFDQDTLNKFHLNEVIHSSYHDNTGIFKKISKWIKGLFKCFHKKNDNYDVIPLTLQQINDYNNSLLT